MHLRPDSTSAPERAHPHRGAGCRASGEGGCRQRHRTREVGTSVSRTPQERRWLFADQLGEHFLDEPDQPVLLIEATGVLRRRRFHRQKAHLVLSALRTARRCARSASRGASGGADCRVPFGGGRAGPGTSRSPRWRGRRSSPWSPTGCPPGRCEDVVLARDQVMSRSVLPAAHRAAEMRSVGKARVGTVHAARTAASPAAAARSASPLGVTGQRRRAPRPVVGTGSSLHQTAARRPVPETVPPGSRGSA